jgi:hypothetical protein
MVTLPHVQYAHQKYTALLGFDESAITHLNEYSESLSSGMLQFYTDVIQCLQ